MRPTVRAGSPGGQSPQRALAQADSKFIRERYDEATDQARERGMFGAPSFVADGRELFRGDDRLEDAIEFAAIQDASTD